MTEISPDQRQSPEDLKENIKNGKALLEGAKLVSWWTDPATGDTVLWARIPKA